MIQIEEIMKKIMEVDEETICMNFDCLEDVVTLERALHNHKVSVVMDIRLTEEKCNVKIHKKKINIYDEQVEDLHIEEVDQSYVINSLVKKVPIGMSDYRNVKKANAYCVDKTKMIETLLQGGDEVTLITRPRRFGKTLNMSMLAEFFDITKDSSELFKDTYIYHTKYVKEMNKWPVIFLSFFDCKGDEGFMMESLIGNLLNEFDKYSLEFDNITPIGFKRRIEKVYDILLRNAESDKELFLIQEALSLLIRFLYEKYDKEVILLIDEYDTPFTSAYVHMTAKSGHL